MTATPTVVGEGQLAGATAILMAPVSGLTVLGACVFSNTNSTVETIAIYLVREGGAPGPLNLKITAQVLAVGQTYVAPELAGAVLNGGDALYGFATDGGVVNYTLNGASIS